MQHLPTVPSLPIGNVNPGVIRFVDQLVELDLSGLLQLYNPYWEVKTWTTDGFYRETVEMVQYRKEEGCQVVEMECSALAACAKFRKVTWAMLLFSADTLADPHKYQEREWGKTSISIALELALDAVLSVVEE